MPAAKLDDEETDEADALRSLTLSSIAKLKQLQAGVSAQMEKGEATAAVQREASALARAIVALGAEMRQQEKFWLKEADRLDLDGEEAIVIEWLGDQTATRRARIRRAMDSMDAETSLLG